MTDKPVMTINKAEAAAALAAIGQTQQRSSALYGYRFNAPMLMLWGAIWLTTDLLYAYAPSQAVLNWGWPVASTTGGLLSSLYYWRYTKRHGSPASDAPRSRAFFWRIAATWLFSGLFIFMLLTIFAPFEWRDIHAFWGLFVGLIYACYGVWNGWRMIVVGAGLTALTMFAFLRLPETEFLVFMGVVCGGGMILGGLWLRRA